MPKSNKKSDWKKVGPIPGLPYAQMISEVLEKENIPFSLTQDGVATAYGYSGTNLAGNKAFIWVPQEFEERVKEIIERLIDHI